MESPIILLTKYLAVRRASSMYLCYALQLQIVFLNCLLHNGLAQNSLTHISILKAVTLKTDDKQKINFK